MATNHDVLNPKADQLNHAVAKITYLGEQTTPIPTVIFYIGKSFPGMRQLLSLQRNNTSYANDTMPNVAHFSVTPAEFKTMLAALEPLLTNIQENPHEKFLSFVIAYPTMYNLAEGSEFKIGKKQGEDFYARLIGALSSTNKPGADTLSKQRRNIYPMSSAAVADQKEITNAAAEGETRIYPSCQVKAAAALNYQ